jgi:hypothetical protein
MHSQKQKRRRGVILTPQGLKKLQTAKAEAESCENKDRRYTLEDLSIRTDLDPDTLMKVFTCETGVDKRTLNRCFQAFNLLLEQSDYDLPTTVMESVEISESAIAKSLPDWGEAPDVSVFYGRIEELTTLTQWILEDRCRLVTLLGMGGMGKTSLSVKLAEQIQHQFQYVIWRSLSHAPPITELLAELIQFLSNQQDTDLPETVYGRVSRLIHYLRASRCLLIFDHVETILQGCNLQESSCNYGLKFYSRCDQGYGELLRRLGETRHQSCLVLTSRERPKEIGLLEGETLPVRVLKLKSLQVAEAKEIFKAKGSFSGSTTEWNKLIHYYAGNPLVLNIVSTTIQKLFDGSISEFLNQKTVVFGEIRNFLEQQLEPLLDVEKEIIKWLAINHQPASFTELRENILPLISSQKLLEALESLEGRCLIERSTILIKNKSALFFLQPLVREYVTDRLTSETIAEVPLQFFFDNDYRLLAEVGNGNTD